jgi:branched-chain amino acid transport system permease protein
MDSFIQQVVAGVATGGIYASIALAMVMIYKATHHLNFAQGEMAMFSTYIAWTLVQAGVPYWVAFAATVALSFAGGVVIERVLLRATRSAPHLSVVIVFVGLLVIFNSVAGWIWSSTLRSFPSPFPSTEIFGQTYVSGHQLGSIGITLGILVLLYLFFRFTRLGLAMRAAAYNPVSSELAGVPVGWMLGLGWGLGSALGAIAGMLIAPVVYLDPNMMSGVLLYGFAAALVGGIENPAGAVVGGILVGVLENLVGTYVTGPELKLTVALVVIIAVLTVRPAGLLGRIVVTRV